MLNSLQKRINAEKNGGKDGKALYKLLKYLTLKCLKNY